MTVNIPLGLKKGYDRKETGMNNHLLVWLLKIVSYLKTKSAIKHNPL